MVEAGSVTESEPRYDVALSFAGEQRSYVEAVAGALRDSGIKVFYDDYEKTALWGRDLYTHLDYVYRQAARFCVTFVSADYWLFRKWSAGEGVTDREVGVVSLR